MSFGSVDVDRLLKGSFDVYKVSNWTNWKAKSDYTGDESTIGGVKVGYIRPGVTVNFPVEYMVYETGVPRVEACRDVSKIGIEVQFTMMEVSSPDWWELVHNGTVVAGETLNGNVAESVYVGQSQNTITYNGWCLVGKDRENQEFEIRVFSGAVYSPDPLTGSDTDYIDQQCTIIGRQDTTQAEGKDLYQYIWEVPSDYYYTLTYDGNTETSGDDPAVEYIRRGESTTALANPYLKTDYSFVEWDTAAAGDGTAYDPTDTVTPTANMTLYAIWEAD